MGKNVLASIEGGDAAQFETTASSTALGVRNCDEPTSRKRASRHLQTIGPLPDEPQPRREEFSPKGSTPSTSTMTYLHGEAEDSFLYRDADACQFNVERACDVRP